MASQFNEPLCKKSPCHDRVYSLPLVSNRKIYAKNLDITKRYIKHIFRVPSFCGGPLYSQYTVSTVLFSKSEADLSLNAQIMKIGQVVV